MLHLVPFTMCRRTTTGATCLLEHCLARVLNRVPSLVESVGVEKFMKSVGSLEHLWKTVVDGECAKGICVAQQDWGGTDRVLTSRDEDEG